MSESTQGRTNGRFILGTVAGVLVGALIVLGVLGQVRPRAAATAPTPSVVTTSAIAMTPSTSPAVPSTPVPATPTDARLASPASNSWFALAHWMPKGTTTLDQAVTYAAGKSSGGRTLVVIDTDVVKLAGGKTGQYAVGLAGLASMAEATAACTAMGLTPGGQCGRYRVT